MKRRYLILPIAMALVALSPVAKAQESVRVPAWSPVVGEKQTWRIELEEARSRSGYPVRFEEEKTTFVQHMTVVGKTLRGHSVLWELDPPETDAEGGRRLQLLMSLFDVRQLGIGVDKGGMPLIAYGAKQRDERLEAFVAALPADRAADADTINGLRDNISADALYEIQMFARAAILIGRLQRENAWTARKGETFRLQQTDHLYDTLVTGEALFTVDETDASAARLKVKWVWDISPDRLPQSMRNIIAQRLAETEGQAPVLPGPLREDASSASFRYSGMAEISLADGSVIAAEEDRTMRIGFESLHLSLRIKRQP